MNKSYQIIIKVLSLDFGIIIFDEMDEDFSISEYIYDSITFVQFILAIESEIGMDLPDDFLNIELLDSAKGFAEKLDSFVDSATKKTCIDK